MNTQNNLPNIIVVGNGEYVSGYNDSVSNNNSDKKKGVILITLLDLKRRKLINEIIICGRSNTKLEKIKQYFNENIQEYDNLKAIEYKIFADDTLKDKSYEKLFEMHKDTNTYVIIATPDDTHYNIINKAIECNLNCLITKPVVKIYDDHLKLIKLLNEKNEKNKNKITVAVEMHKRWDPIYVNAKNKIKKFGKFSYFTSYMSQPKYQLDTFKWISDKSSDISYYLNSHHIDYNIWAIEDQLKDLKQIKISAVKSSGYVNNKFNKKTDDIEDTITIFVEWIFDDYTAHSIYTSSWIAPTSDVHSQQRFFYMGQQGEINIDQAHRGYTFADDNGLKSVNPLFMNYDKNDHNQFVGQDGYGYKSIEAFIQSNTKINNNHNYITDSIANLDSNPQILTTLILEAGRNSLDNDNKWLIYDIKYINSEFNITKHRKRKQLSSCNSS
jgi:D-galacturonate reductase